jgi:hypothetical protein
VCLVNSALVNTTTPKSLMKKTVTLVKSLGLALGLLAAPAGAVEVTFQVNMSVQTSLGTFDPANDFMFVAGSFNDWSTSASILTNSIENPDVYTGTFDVGAAGTWPNFKFVKNRFVGGVQWENNGVGDGGAMNRFFQVPATNHTLPVLYFNNVTNVAVNYAPVTFQVNMSVQIAQGAFDPNSGTVWIAGDAINNWDITVAPIALTQSLADTNIWTTTLSVTNPVSSLVSFKYLMNGNWETIADRTFTMTNSAQTLPVTFYNNVTNVAVPIPLTFTLNLGVQMARGNFNPGNGDIVEVRGSFLTGTGGTWLGGFVLTNDPANPVLFTGTFVDTNDTSGSSIQYQYVLNGGATWESTGNRFVTLTSTNPVSFPVEFFSNVSNLGPITMGSPSAGQSTLSWTAGPLIRLQGSTNLTLWETISGTEGLGAADVNLETGYRFFRLVGP